ncbi:MAG: FkbM family methyltransferase [Magnetospirillum sp.]|nr:FkbM family methyltransferase [Magnetospirillum sp.]
MRTPHYSVVAHPTKGTLTRAIIRRGDWEVPESRAFLRYLTPGAVVIDAGANFGHYALLSSGVVGPEGLVIGFEPDPATYALLVENVALLPCPNVKTEQAGLSDRDGVMALSIDGGNPGGHSFSARNVRELGRVVEVPVRTIDAHLADSGIRRPVNLIKIDVQGFEYKVLAGAAGTIGRDRPVVFCEVTPSSMANVGDDFRELLGFFRARGYGVQAIAPAGARSISYDEAERLLGDGREYADMIFAPDPVQR